MADQSKIDEFLEEMAGYVKAKFAEGGDPPPAPGPAPTPPKPDPDPDPPKPRRWHWFPDPGA